MRVGHLLCVDRPYVLTVLTAREIPEGPQQWGPFFDKIKVKGKKKARTFRRGRSRRKVYLRGMGVVSKTNLNRSSVTIEVWWVVIK